MRYLIGAPKVELRADQKIMAEVRKYAEKFGATEKVVGDVAWRTPRYDERTKRGRLIRRIKSDVDTVTVWDSKKGYVKIPLVGKEEILPKAKEPWQMTKKEFMANPPEEVDIWLMENKPPHRGKIGAISDFLGGPPTKGYRVANTLTPFDIAHKNILKHTLREGKSIPPEVLADYPELAPKAEIRIVKERPNTFRFYEGEKELGFATRVRDMEKGKDFYIGRLISHEEGKGYGTRMTQALIDYAKKQGHETVTLVASRPASIRIGEKLGFKQIGKWGTDAILRLNIAPKTSEKKYLI